MWNPEKWYTCVLSESRTRDTEVENKLMVTTGGMNCEIGIGIYTLLCVK